MSEGQESCPSFAAPARTVGELPTIEGAEPVMTLKVYEVNRAGTTTRVLRQKAPVVPLTTAEPHSAFPDCECQRCQAKHDAPYRTLLGHTTQCATCRAGAPCVTAVRLGRAWRDSR
jgi:hypothetical protein